MKTKHTPGKWKTTTIRSNGAGNYPGVISDNNRMVASCSSGTSEETEANAILIAQAPLMRKALQDCMVLLEHMARYTDQYNGLYEKEHCARRFDQATEALK